MVQFWRKDNISEKSDISTDDRDLKTHHILEETRDLESTSSSEVEHIFKDPVIAEFYGNIYENCKYECRHLFDPDFEWTEKEEKKIVRKNDWYVTFWALIMFIALDFDRGNIQQANSADFLSDLGMNTNDYNTGQTIFLVCFLAAELPSQLISKKIGSDIWVPIQLCSWSIISMCQTALTNKAGFFVCRALLGAFQGGFIADVCLWMSYFYTSAETPMRLSIFYIANPLTNVFCSLIALGLLKISTSAIPEGWKWMFLIEGLLTFLIGVISFFKMPSSVVKTKTWYRKKGWYTSREEKILVNKVLRDDPRKGDLNNRTAVSLPELIRAALDFDLLFIYIARFLLDIGSSPVSAYLQILLKKMGFTTAVTNALSVPYNFLTIFMMLLTSWFSVRWRSYSLVLASIPVWILLHLFILRFWPDAQINKWGTWVLLTFLIGHAPSWPLSIGWCSANSNSVRNRTVSAAVVNIFSQAGGIVSSNIYREDDRPLYHTGNTVLIVLAFVTFFWLLATRQWFIYRNNQRDKVWNAMTKEEQHEYTLTTTDKGNKRLEFRFAY